MSKLLRGIEEINPYDHSMAFKMLEVGLDTQTYKALQQSFTDNVHTPLNQTIDFSGQFMAMISDDEKQESEFENSMKAIYKSREYFKTLRYKHE